MKNRYVIIDTETSGNHLRKDRVIEIGLVVVENGLIVDRYSTFVNPNLTLSPFIKQFTGITDDMLTHAPTYQEVNPIISKYLNDAVFVAHNVPFDLSFIQEEQRRIGSKVFSGSQLDTVELARILYPCMEGYKLNQLAEFFSIDHTNPHRADSDAYVTAQLFIIMMNKLKKLPLQTLKNLCKVSKHLKSDLYDIFKEALYEKEREVADNQFDEYIGLALKKQNVDFEDNITKEVVPFHEAKQDVLNQMRTVLPDFEERPGQLEMMNGVDQSLHTEKHLLVEAGTGIGKTLAYLISAVSFAKEKKRPVVVSTYTNHLQHQILDHDIPILKQILPYSFNETILKGKNHYLCLRKFKELLDEQEENYDLNLTKAQILVWITETKEGDLGELNLPSGGALLWSRITANIGNCEGCSATESSKCYYQLKKIQTKMSDLIITNHALLLKDLTTETFLPPYQEVIIDEAHHLEDVGSQFFGKNLSYLSIQSLLSRLETVDSRQLLGKIYKLASTHRLSRTMNIIYNLSDKLTGAKEESDDLFRLLHHFVLEVGWKQKSDVGRIRYQYDIEEEDCFLWEHVQESARRLKFNLMDIISWMKDVSERCKGIDHLNRSEKGLIHDFDDVFLAIEEIGTQITSMLLKKDNDMVNWIEVEEKGALNASFLYGQPINVNEQLKEFLFTNKKSVILTSATLTDQNGSFEFIKKQLGLTSFSPNELKIPSSFPYAELVKLMVPNDIPPINEVNDDVFVKNITKHIIEIAAVSKGRMLILFTSFDLLQKTYMSVKKQLNNDTFDLIGQGITSGSREKLIKKFKQFDSAILFGTNSFWEGIDIPGDDLSCLIIVRLPFSSPENPLFKARAKKMKAKNQNVFVELSLPEAVMRFKQGFGRLVRTNKDKGVIFVFDRRVVTKAYGTRFIDTLPSIEVIEDHTPNLLKILKEWL